MTNKEIFEDIYVNFNKNILYYLTRVLKDYHQAEDLMHETFLKAYRKMDTFKKDSNILTWLYAIAHNVAVDYIRKQNKLNVCLQRVKMNSYSLWHPDPAMESTMDFMISFSKLKLSYRQVITLRRFKDYTTNEAGEKLNWSDSKVKTTLSRATCKLEKQLIEDEQHNN
ncbi:RNA polymerase sigma factor [Aquibacillus kalidii]|uniref:RNA polymerase sigma factor n=1 Tax=Aquibacillus kalidii TaxID=2762597 RepID=UPI001646B3F5|nr:RNA polymerase sigma factor [Aquibacillus kalidii]